MLVSPSGRDATAPTHRIRAATAFLQGQYHMKPMKFGIGQAVKRVEDARLIRGEGKYTADVVPEGTLAAVFLRSPQAHARFTIADVAAAKAAPGVRLILTAADVCQIGDLPCLAALPNS